MNFLHEEDWQIFMAQIEPGIRQFIQEYFRDWQRIEEYVTSIVMKHKGMFTERMIVTRIEGEDATKWGVADVSKFQKDKRSMFKRKMEYLQTNGLISQPLFGLLMRLSERRNKVHDYDETLSDDDRVLFERGAALLHPTYLARCFEEQADTLKYIMLQADQEATALIGRMQAQESSRFKGDLFFDLDLDRIKGGWERQRAM